VPQERSSPDDETPRLSPPFSSYAFCGYGRTAQRSPNRHGNDTRRSWSRCRISDLKESLVSLGSHLANLENSPCATFPEFQKYFGRQVIPVAHSYYRWKTSWLSNLDSFQILQISYADLKADFPSVSKRILDFYNIDLPSVIASTLYDQIKNDISFGNRKTAVREKNVPSSFLSSEQITYIDSNFSDYF